MNFIERAIPGQTSSIATNDTEYISAAVSGKADTPVYLLTMYKGIGDAVAFGLRVFLMPAEPEPKLLDVAAFIDQAEVFVTGDTGLMHLAATFKKVSPDDSTLYYPHNGTHIIALFGGTNPGLYGYRERTTILGRGRKEQLAFKPGIAKETYNPRGKNLFDHITPEQLTEAILNL